MRSITIIASDWMTHLHRGCSDRSTILLMYLWSITLGVKTCKWHLLCKMGPHFPRRFSDWSHFFITKVAIDHYSLLLNQNYTYTQKLQWSIKHFFNGCMIDPVKTCKWHQILLAMMAWVIVCKLVIELFNLVINIVICSK